MSAATSGRTFIALYRPGVLLAPAPGCLLAPIFVVPGFALTQSLALSVLIAAAAFLVTSWLWTIRRRRRPALILSDDGVEIDGLPRIPWGLVHAVKPGPNETEAEGLVVRLKQQLFGPGGTANRANLLTPLWRPLEENALLLRTPLLQDPSPDIERAFRYFLGR
jgi:hypothetical protein